MWAISFMTGKSSGYNGTDAEWRLRLLENVFPRKRLRHIEQQHRPDQAAKGGKCQQEGFVWI